MHNAELIGLSRYIKQDKPPEPVSNRIASLALLVMSVALLIGSR